ncbi:MAG TPA: sensor histidine kinase [Roseiflexaceae bacterium]
MQPSPTLLEEATPTNQATHALVRWLDRVAVAWILCAVTLALLVGALVLFVASLSVVAAEPAAVPAYVAAVLNNPLRQALMVLDDASLVVFVVLGTLIVVRYPRHPIGWIFVGLGCVGVLEQFCKYYAVYGLLVRPGTLPFPLAAAWVTEWSWVIFFGLLGAWLPLLFPSGRLLSPRWRPIAWLAAGAMAGLVPSMAVKPGPFGNISLLEQIDNPLGYLAPMPLLEIVSGVSFVSLLTSMLLAAAAVVVRLRRATGDERQQMKWFCYPAALLALLFIVQGIVRHVLGIESTAFEIGFALTWALVFGFLPVAAGIAILKYRLYKIDLVINRTLVYGALSASIAGIYVLVVGALSALFQTRGDLAISLIATALVALLFQPLRAWLQRSVNRLLYGERDEPYAVLSRLGRRLEATLAPNAVLPTLVETVKDALKLPYVAIALATNDERRMTNDERQAATNDSSFVPSRSLPLSEAKGLGQALGPSSAEDAFEVAAAAGTPVDDLLRLPLVYQTETIGALLLGPRAPGEAFSSADRRLLDDLSRQAGVAAHALRLTADLQRSRERLVTAREEERRRLRRDLHDGLGPQLATQTLKLEAARDLVVSDPARAVDLLSGLIDDSQAAIADIRRLVYALRPPALDELGLVGAIREQAAQYQQAGGHDGAALHIVVDAPERLPPLPAAVEVAAYRIALEALNNVAKHAAARTCVISLGVGNGLHLDIRDNGCGLPPDRHAGVGLTSMCERAAELGGKCEIGPAPGGGTSVVAWLPLLSVERST